MSKRETVEGIVVAWLNDTLADYKASTNTPKGLPVRYCLVRRTGGGRQDIVGDAAEIRIEVFDKNSQVDCAEIANYIADHIELALPAEYEDVTAVKVNSIISLDDKEKQYYRYQLFIDIFHSRVGSDEEPTPTPVPSA